jgi:peptidoglycan/LPS O-acetylase OafA/YrhL
VPGKRDSRGEPIPALTGLRFVAALSVAVAHGFAQMSNQPNGEPIWHSWFLYCAAFGMSTFFVLSGFVIHYNYSENIKNFGWRGLYNFFIARFARIYPLYIVCVITLIYYHDYVLSLAKTPIGTRDQFWQLFPYYITLTQSWKYCIVGSNSLIYGFPFSQTIQITWSISTEAFFYLAYPVICVGIGRLQKTWHKFIAAGVISLGALGLMGLAFYSRTAIDQFGVSHFGPIAGMSHGFQDSFFRWVIYFAPYSRLPEFLLGCLAAALYRQWETRGPSVLEAKRARIVGNLTLISILGGISALALPSINLPYFKFFHMNFGFAIPVVILIFVAARYQSAFSRIFSWKWVVRCGDASYSIYLFHPIFIGHAGLATFAIGTSAIITSAALLRLAIALLVTVAFSMVTYRILELPARRLLRRILTIDTRRAAIRPSTSLPIP